MKGKRMEGGGLACFLGLDEWEEGEDEKVVIGD